MSEHISKREYFATSIDKLPPLKEGFQRVVHITNKNSAEEVKSSGLNYSGTLSSTARSWSRAEDCEYSSNDPRFSFDDAVVVVMDVPQEEMRIHENIEKSPENVPAKYLVGIFNMKN